MKIVSTRFVDRMELEKALSDTGDTYISLRMDEASPEIGRVVLCRNCGMTSPVTTICPHCGRERVRGTRLL